MRVAMQIGYRLRRLALRWLRIRTRGVKVMVFNSDGELLLIRNSYGRTHEFVLPGGGVGRRESPHEAAVREVREEVGIGIERLRFVSHHSSAAEGKRDTIHLFSAITRDAPEPDGLEVEEARFFPLDRLPETVSAATLRRLAEHKAERPLDGRW